MTEISGINIIFLIFNFFKKNIKYLVVSILLAILISLLFTHWTPALYRSNLVGVSSILNTEDIYPILNKVKNLIKDENIEELQLHFPLPVDLLRKIRSVEVTSEILVKNKKNNEEQIKNKFNIEIVVSDYMLFDTLNVLVPQYIRNNKYTKLKTELVNYRKEKLYSKLREEIDMLDSIKYDLVKSQISSKADDAVYLNSPSLINESIIRLYDQQLQIYETLKLKQDFMVIEDFVKIRNPFNKNYIKNALIASALCFLVTVSVLILVEINAYVSKIEV